MVKAVRYDEFGGIEVLRVDEVERPVPGDGQVLVRVKAAGINISEAVIRTGAVAELFPSTFPSGQGSDLAGVVEEVGAGVGGFSPGDEVIGFTNRRASQAELAQAFSPYPELSSCRSSMIRTKGPPDTASSDSTLSTMAWPLNSGAAGRDSAPPVAARTAPGSASQNSCPPRWPGRTDRGRSGGPGPAGRPRRAAA